MKGQELEVDNSETDQSFFEISRAISDLRAAHYRMLLLVGGRGRDRTVVLKGLANKLRGEFTDVGMFLSRTLIEIEPGFRAHSVFDVFSNLIGNSTDNPVCLDHIEILFDQGLHIAPFELLKNVSRKFLLVVSWPGIVADGMLEFGSRQHPSNFRISVSDIECPVHELEKS